MKKADEILRQILKDLHIDENVPYSSFFNNWEKVAGIDIANHSVPEEVKNAVLYVSVDHPGWVQVILLKKRDIIRKVNALFPELHIENMRVFYKKHQLTE